MRNLLGRLHTRDEAELSRIMTFWRVARSGGTRHMAVGTLYRTMIDIRTIRAAWGWLTPEQQEMVRLLAVVDDARAQPTLAQLAGWLDAPLAATREVAVQLYRIGILAREGDDQPLPVGTEPRVFLPRELALLFRRLLDDIDAGDLSMVPLPALMDRLDDAEIENAAAVWGLKVIPGTRNRDDLGRRLLRQIGTPGGVERVVSKLPADAAKVWRAVLNHPHGSPARLEEIAAASGFAADEPRAIRRWHDALHELETALLVWHTYGANEERLLFIPAEIRSPRPPVPVTLPPLQPVLDPEGEAPPWRFPHALAWDFLTLLRELADPEQLPWLAGGDYPRSRLRRLNHRFWIRGRDQQPPPGYVGCLLALARAEGLLRVDEETDEYQVTPAVRGWRERSFPAQTERLRWWWLASADWIEGQGREEMEIWGADWPTARRNLVAALSDPAVGLEPDTWYTLDSVAARIATHLPGLLGSNFTVATARMHTASDDATARLTTIAELITIEFETMFSWLGLVEIRAAPGQPSVMRLLPEATSSSATGQATPEVALSDGHVPPLVVSASGAIELRDPTPLRVWSLSAFADLEVLGQPSVYRLSAASIRRALAAGFELEHVTAFLTRQGGVPLPEEVLADLATWTTGYRRVRVQPAFILTPDDPASLDTVRDLASNAGWHAMPLESGAILLRRTNKVAAATESDLVELLRAQGFAPLVSPVVSANP